MEDLIFTLDKKEAEITAYLADNRAEKEGLMARLKELDESEELAEEDLRRINKARNALRNPTEAPEARAVSQNSPQTLGESLAELKARAVPQYYPPTTPRRGR